MFRSKTVFIVGAGASCELGFPSGSKLLEQIATALDIRFPDGFDMSSGDRRIYNAYQRLATGPDGRRSPVNVYQHAGWRVRDAAYLGLSIDNVINQFADDALVATIGKIAIARQILLAEQNSSLRISRERRDSVEVLGDVRGTWLGSFAQLLVQDMNRANIDGIFENVSVVSFNYDRSVRRFLPLALQSQFGILENAAQEIAAGLPIYHPYGSLGPLPWEGTADGVEYGDADHADLFQVSERIRTFTEQIDDGEQLAPMRQALSSAERIVFLGFGYHRQNMALLSQGVVGNAARVFGTAMGLSEADKEVVSGQLSHFVRQHYRAHVDPKLTSLGCVQFINEYFRALTA